MRGLLIVVASFVALPGESHRQSSLAGYSLFGHKELDTTERLTLSLSAETEPCAPAAVDLQHPPEGIQGGMRHSVLQRIWWGSWIFSGTDFMIPILASHL